MFINRILLDLPIKQTQTDMKTFEIQQTETYENNQQDLLNLIKDAKYFYEYYESYAEDAKRQGEMEVYWNMQDSIEEQRSVIFRATEKLNQL